MDQGEDVRRGGRETSTSYTSLRGENHGRQPSSSSSSAASERRREDASAGGTGGGKEGRHLRRATGREVPRPRVPRRARCPARRVPSDGLSESVSRRARRRTGRRRAGWGETARARAARHARAHTLLGYARDGATAAATAGRPSRSRCPRRPARPERVGCVLTSMIGGFAPAEISSGATGSTTRLAVIADRSGGGKTFTGPTSRTSRHHCQRSSDARGGGDFRRATAVSSSTIMAKAGGKKGKKVRVRRVSRPRLDTRAPRRRVSFPDGSTAGRKNDRNGRPRAAPPRQTRAADARARPRIQWRALVFARRRLASPLPHPNLRTALTAVPPSLVNSPYSRRRRMEARTETMALPSAPSSAPRSWRSRRR